MIKWTLTCEKSFHPVYCCKLLKYRFKDLGAQTAPFRILTKFENMNDKEIEDCLNTLAESNGMDPIPLATEFENWMGILLHEDENLNNLIEVSKILTFPGNTT